MISVLLADHQLSRQGLQALMEKHQECEVKGGASNGHEALQKLEAIKPDILLADIEIPGIDGIELVRQTREKSPDTRCIIYSTKSDDHNILMALRAGVKGYVLKTASFDQLGDALKAVYSGGIYLSEEVLQKIIDYYCDGNHDTAGQEALSAREKEVLLLVKDGLTNVEIGRRLGISHRTVEAHRFRAMKKLHLRNQAELVRYFIEKPVATHVS